MCLLPGEALAGIASRKRGAWIETSGCSPLATNYERIASRKRGAWIETLFNRLLHTSRPGIASRKRGAWIETNITWFLLAFTVAASPPGNGGRGLKPTDPCDPAISAAHRLPETGGVD